jgi:hypothetical protein
VADARPKTTPLDPHHQRRTAFIQNVRRGHYELGLDTDLRHRLPAAFAELALAI